MSFEPLFLFWAMFIGGMSAISLPAGSVAGLMFRPRASIMAVVNAFGAGALLAALALELVGPTVQTMTGGHEGRGAAAAVFTALIIGAAAGGVFFVLLERAVDARGGFLRKKATTIAWFSADRRRRLARVLEDLGRIEVLRHLSEDNLRALVEMVRPLDFRDGQTLFHEGEEGDRMFFLCEGQVALTHGGSFFKVLEPGDVLGEMTLLTGAPRSAEAVARGNVRVLALLKKDFDRIRGESPELDEAVRMMAARRMEELSRHREERFQKTMAWTREAVEALSKGKEVPTPAEIRRKSREHGGAALGIWLGTLLDGVPESLVTGISFAALLSSRLAAGSDVSLTQVIPYTLIAGLFLCNFPEAMSSTVGMAQNGWRRRNILVMWLVVLLMTMVGAGIGYVVCGIMPRVLLVGLDGLAAGAMLTMIASTMLPEAVHLGSPSAVGLSTLGGFLAAVAFKLIE
ncbi:MAG: cyclic nucleotide-binding domain-containing protein [Thermodesulfobacteriota bacterium]